MAVSSHIDPHLEMILNKKNRCEDWVTTVTLRNQRIEREQGLGNEDELSEMAEEFSDDVCVSSDGPRRRVRKVIVNEKLQLKLTCEWEGCDFGVTEKRADFIAHVNLHISNVLVVLKPDGNYCYQCSWRKCDFQTSQSGEIKRHVHFHAYHTTLKATASRLNELWELSGCPLPGENCNRLPHLPSSYKCEVSTCDYETDLFSTFIGHVNGHVERLNLKEEPVMSCKWKGCTKFKCRKKAFMKVHMKCHTGEKSLACPKCGSMFASNTKYMDHCNRRVPNQDESNQCQYCLRFYPNDRLLRDHMRYHINSHKCSFCEMTFSTPAVLAKHVRYKHINVRPFQCSHCSFTAVTKDDFDTHLLTHGNEPKYKCQVDTCDFSCRSLETMNKHFNSTHLKAAPPIYKCHLCDKVYNRGPSLGMHLRVVHKLERLPGHSRFRYMENKDGYYRLQVERYESLELNNFKGPLVSIDSDMNFQVEEQRVNNESSRKFTVTMKDNNEKTRSSIIAIDELDADGNVVYSTTVDKNLMDNSDFFFVDVENCTELDLSEEENEVITPDLKEQSQPLPSRSNRKRRIVSLSDHDCTIDEFVVRE